MDIPRQDIDLIKQAVEAWDVEAFQRHIAGHPEKLTSFFFAFDFGYLGLDCPPSGNWVRHVQGLIAGGHRDRAIQARLIPLHVLASQLDGLPDFQLTFLSGAILSGSIPEYNFYAKENLLYQRDEPSSSYVEEMIMTWLGQSGSIPMYRFIKKRYQLSDEWMDKLREAARHAKHEKFLKFLDSSETV